MELDNTVLKNYQVHETIGSGGFAKVKLATHITTDEKVAVKIMNKHQLGADLPRAYIEIEAMKNIWHQNICRLYEVIETDTTIYMIVEYCPAGELFDYIVSRDRLEEDEARKFFRDIISAVAYLHQLGYAHRDLKPENLLLDEENRLKLIDFGLCARPKYGLGDPLSTCCGSPAYAAPELISGRNYFGNEADVWSMGVLLYALVCGFLPFDDDNIGQLYRKIKTGKYDKPRWLSVGLLVLLDQMLQVDPKCRITVRHLLNHPWMLEGDASPIKYESEYRTDELDEICVCEFARHRRMNPQNAQKLLKQWNYDENTALYLLLVHKKRKGRLNQVDIPLGAKRHLAFTQESPTRAASLDRGLDDVCLLELGSSLTGSVKLQRKTEEENKENFIRPRNPTPVKPPRTNSVKKKSIFDSGDIISPSRSIESQLQDITNSMPRSPVTPRTPKSGKKVFGSIERGLDRVRNILTPRKHSSTNSMPAVAKTLYNVSSTSSRNPDYVMSQLIAALQKKGVVCKQKGYNVRGKLKDRYGKTKLSFELEVCMVAHLGLVGVRRRRLNGDAWFYKRVCEAVLKLADLSSPSKCPY